jgi:hypothetical protein
MGRRQAELGDPCGEPTRGVGSHLRQEEGHTGRSHLCSLARPLHPEIVRDKNNA